MRQEIIDLIKEKGELSGSEIARFIGVSRQAVNKYILRLVKSGVVKKTGSTRNAKYSISNAAPQRPLRVEKLLKLGSVAEDEVFKEVSLFLNLRKELSENAFKIFRYSFTEILNNAIEHAESDKCKITVEIDPLNALFVVRDFGIGIFYSIASNFDLQYESESVLELAKGKRTTIMEKHTGEGIFFTSKLGDFLKFRSHKIMLTFDNDKKDTFLGSSRYLKGTEVHFSIRKHSKRKISGVFNQYAPKEFDYKFARTKVLINLLQSEYISRSEAKRLLVGLDKFREIVLDFKGVKNIGQGFADEVFRVFKLQHQGIDIKIVNLAPALKKIIKHVS